MISTSHKLREVVQGVAKRIGLDTFNLVTFGENPERAELPCVKFGNIVIWAFPKGGAPDGELVWMADYTKETLSNESGPSNSTPKEIISGVSVFDAVRAGFKIYLDEKMDGALELEKGYVEWEADKIKNEGWKA